MYLGPHETSLESWPGGGGGAPLSAKLQTHLVLIPRCRGWGRRTRLPGGRAGAVNMFDTLLAASFEPELTCAGGYFSTTTGQQSV